MNQAARLAPALRRACDLSRALLPPSASLQSGRVQPHRRRRLWPEGSGHGPLVSTSSASGVECPVGTPLHPWAPAITSAAADGGSVSRSACAPALGSGRFAPCGGAAWPLAARNRGLAPRDRGDDPPADAGTAALHSFVVPLRLVACTDGAATFQLVPASTAPRRPFRRSALLEHPRANDSVRFTHCASLRSLRHGSRSPFRCAPLRARTARPALRSGPLRAASPGALRRPLRGRA